MLRLCSIAAALLVFSCACLADDFKVDVTYSPGFDTACALTHLSSIDEAWKTELQSRQEEFIELWKADGPRLIATTEAITGKAFPPHEIEARLTLCDIPSQAWPSLNLVFVNMRYTLKSAVAQPVPVRYKVDSLFHELLHVFLAEHPVRESALLPQHAAELARTREHLHLQSLQKAVLLQLHEDKELQEAIAIDSQLPGGYYKRAWEIINATDTEYLKYVAEISR